MVFVRFADGCAKGNDTRIDFPKDADRNSSRHEIIGKTVPSQKPLSRHGLFELMAAKSPSSLFLTGKAGSGKTTLIKQFAQRYCRRLNIVITAFTGLAALNAEGQTLHSFFCIDFNHPDDTSKIDSQPKELYTKLDILIIDEVSMVRASDFEEIDRRLRRVRNNQKPFGGVKLILVGDYYQIPPINSFEEQAGLKKEQNYVFETPVYRELEIQNVLLTRYYRHSDPEFIFLLNKIRTRKDLQNALQIINTRVIPQEDDDETTTLTTKNEPADRANRQRLALLSGKEETFYADRTGSFQIRKEERCPASLELSLKLDAKIMFIKNDLARRWVNGDLGRVTALSDDYVEITKQSGETVTVAPETWEDNEYAYNATTGEIGKKVRGKFTQLPLKLAWALTIHKCQGQTLLKTVIDFSQGSPFVHGHTYVALSRARTLQGIRLVRAITESDVIVDPKVTSFLESQGLEEEDSAADLAMGIEGPQEEEARVVKPRNKCVRTGEAKDDCAQDENARVVSDFSFPQTIMQKSQLHYHNARSECLNAYEPWLPKEDEQLRKEFGQKMPLKLVAETHQRMKGAIKSRLKKIGLIKSA
jgi:GTPase SAR1 family protein